jgi:hypothetical protein
MPEAACCGDFCGKCPHYPHNCAGCRTGERVDCFFIQCCGRHKIEHCGQCDEFPCCTLQEFVPDDRPGCPSGFHIENLRARVAMGDEKWLAQQRAQWEALLQSSDQGELD